MFGVTTEGSRKSDVEEETEFLGALTLRYGHIYGAFQPKSTWL